MASAASTVWILEVRERGGSSGPHDGKRVGVYASAPAAWPDFEEEVRQHAPAGTRAEDVIGRNTEGGVYEYYEASLPERPGYRGCDVRLVKEEVNTGRRNRGGPRGYDGTEYRWEPLSECGVPR